MHTQLPYAVFLTLVFNVLSTETALAVVGDTAEQLINRYGKPTHHVKPPGDRPPFGEHFMAWEGTESIITVILHNGRSVSESYKVGKDISGPDDPRAQFVLKQNGGADEWLSDAAVSLLYDMGEEAVGSEKRAKFAWLRKNENNKCYAAVHEGQPDTLHVRSPEFFTAREEARAATAR